MMWLRFGIYGNAEKKLEKDPDAPQYIQTILELVTA